MIGAAKMLASVEPVAIFGVSINPNPKITASPPGGATSTDVTAYVSGGIAPFTFLWTRISGSLDITISSTTDQVVQFSASGSGGEQKTAIWQCQVTDSDAPPEVVTDEVTVIFNFISR